MSRILVAIHSNNFFRLNSKQFNLYFRQSMALVYYYRQLYTIRSPGRRASFSESAVNHLAANLTNLLK